jgi:hypothetical protein
MAIYHGFGNYFTNMVWHKLYILRFRNYLTRSLSLVGAHEKHMLGLVNIYLIVHEGILI